MYDFRNTEEKVGKFWKEHDIFEKTLEKTRKGKRFVFWEGPPTANGVPHTGHFLTRIYKDLYGRYKTMRGFFVLRKAGWDTHGLPVEIEVEKELGFKNKKQIEEFGIEKFNRKCRESAQKYKAQWEDMTSRMGYWLDMARPYITYETEYMESVWNILSEIWKKDLLYKAHKVVHYCSRCGTSLSAHEVAQGYKTVTDRSVTVKFRILNPNSHNLSPNTYILAWTTTPWTLPGNVALAVGEKIVYVIFKPITNLPAGQAGNPQPTTPEIYIAAKDLVPKILDTKYEILDTILGSDLVGLEYEPLFEVPLLRQGSEGQAAYKVYPADFVSTTEGTGVVHTAVMYGEDDYILGTKVGLPKFHTVDGKGQFVDSVGADLAGKYVKDPATEDLIIEKLKTKNLLLKVEDFEHEYPFCWRCDTPLLYYAKSSWFIRTSALNKELLENNSKVNWIPGHIRDGRFGQWLKEAKDWNLSRERYWGTPLPIWQCQIGKPQTPNPKSQIDSNSEIQDKKQNGCGHTICIGSIKELEKLSLGSKNTYYVMRHGGTNRNEETEGIVNYNPDTPYDLTEDGKKSVEQSLELLKLDGVDMIFTSPSARTRQTAEIAARALHKEVNTDDRLIEYNLYGFANEGKPVSSIPNHGQKRGLNAKETDGESYNEMRSRVADFMNHLEKTYRNKKILIVSHGSPIRVMAAMASGSTIREFNSRSALGEWFEGGWTPQTGEIKKLEWRKIPRNEYGELDLHRPFIDDVVIKCPHCKLKMRKIPDLIDVWFDSGAMPYAQWHWPFENKDMIIPPSLKLRRTLPAAPQFPADFIVEGVDQTRGWFWTLMAISTLLGKGAPYKNVMSLGLTLDEKGQKMSKSKGNYVPVPELMNRHGVDVLRWFFFSSMTIGEDKAVTGREVDEKLKGFFFTFQNCIKFYELYLTNDQRPTTNDAESEVVGGRLSVVSSLDKWIMSRLHRLIQSVTEKLDAYDVTPAAKEVEYFVIEDLSNWWLRRSRKRKEALPLLRHVLLETAKLLAPFAPFMAEDCWQKLASSEQRVTNSGESVHLADWPKVQKKYINDKLETEMASAREVIAKGLAERKEKQLKVRQPLALATIKTGKFSKDLEILIRDELNVKKVKYSKDIEWDIVLDIELTPELCAEGYSREMMRQIQDMRKEAKYKMEDLATVHWYAFDSEVFWPWSVGPRKSKKTLF